jgi:starch synthase
MNVLHIASEGDPFVKTGGLADVIGALPKALQGQGVEVRVILPKYSKIPQHFRERMTLKQVIHVGIGWRNQYCGIEELEHGGIHYYFIDNEQYFNRDGLYGYYDEAERYAYFCRAVLAALPHLDFQPDVLHCHDWQTALIPLLLRAHYGDHPFYQGMRTVFTIHNLLYQGIFPHQILEDLIGVGYEYFTVDGLEHFDCVNFMKGALNYADKITTVSSTYAGEIQTEYFGEKVDGLLRKRAGDLLGIVNGIDYESYNPETDPHLFFSYNLKESVHLKRENKWELQKQLGLPAHQEVPMIGIISRFVEQKGFDLILHVLEDLLQHDVQLVILGTGEAKYEWAFREMAMRYPDKLSVNIRFDEGFARQIYAASDLFLMPSRFEPCGLSQLLALRYGSVPIVRETGGLRDTVRPYDEFQGTGNGFSFTNFNAHDMLYTILRALHFYKDEETWAKILANVATCDFSWRESAKQYRMLYEQLVPQPAIV